MVTACERIGEHTRECVAACDGILTHERQHGPTRAVNVSELETKIDVLAAYSSVGEANASASAVVHRLLEPAVLAFSLLSVDRIGWC